MNRWHYVGLGVVGAAVVASLAMLTRASSGRPLAGSAPQSVVAYLPLQGGSIDPCEHLGNSGGIEQNMGFVIDWSVAQWTETVAHVAEVRVESIEGGRFNTPSGGVPTQEPDTAEHASGILIYRPVVLRVEQHYKGDTAVTGFVVPQWGGSHSACPDYVSLREPPEIDAVAGQAGMLFAREQTWVHESAPPWYVALADKAAELNALGGGNNYVPRIIDNWYEFDDPTAHSLLTGDELTILELRSEVEDAVGP